MTTTRTPTPIAMRGFDGFGFCGGAGGSGDGGGGGGFASFTGGGADGVGGASVVIGATASNNVPRATLLAGAGLERAGEIQFVGATRGLMLANTRTRRLAKSHVRPRMGLLSPAGHPMFTCRTRGPRGPRMTVRCDVASRTP